MTILNSIDVINANHNAYFVVFLIIGAMLSVVMAAVAFTEEEDASGIFLCIATVILIICAVCATMDKSYKYTKIEATIDETISAVELLDKYEILDHRGDIYELKYIDEEKLNGKTSAD